jgi:hypothetical protein
MKPLVAISKSVDAMEFIPFEHTTSSCWTFSHQVWLSTNSIKEFNLVDAATEVGVRWASAGALGLIVQALLVFDQGIYKYVHFLSIVILDDLVLIFMQAKIRYGASCVPWRMRRLVAETTLYTLRMLNLLLHFRATL